MGERHADGVARGRVPAGLDHLSEAADPAVSGGAAHQQLAAPDRAVVAETEAVEREPEHLAAPARARPSSRRRARGDAARRRSAAPSEAANRVVMKSGCRSCATISGSIRKTIAEPVERLAVGAHRLLGVEVADVLGEERLAAVRETEGAVEERAGPERRRRRRSRGRSDWERERPCAPQDARRHVTRPHPHDAVVVARHDLPVVDEHRVGDRGETLGGVLVRDADRLVAGVPAGHHERTIAPRAAADGGAAWRAASRPCRTNPGATDGARGRAAVISTIGACQDESTSSSAGVGSNHRRAAATSGTITANGLSGRRFRFAEARDGALVGRVAREVEPPEALHGDDRAGADQRGDDLERVVRRPAAASTRDARAARRARHGLGVEPPVSRVLVLPTAFRAHRERAHRRPLAVVRQCLDDREPRPAVRAVDERVTEPPVAGIEQLGETGGARRGVGRDEPIPCAVDRGVDVEPAQSFARRQASTRRPRRARASAPRRRARPRTPRAPRERLPRGSRRRRSRSARGRRRRGVRRAATRTGGTRRPGPRPGPRSAGPRGPAAPRARHSSYGGLRERGDFVDERVDERRERGGDRGREAVPRGEVVGLHAEEDHARQRAQGGGEPHGLGDAPGRATRARRGARPAARRGPPPHARSRPVPCRPTAPARRRRSRRRPRLRADRAPSARVPPRRPRPPSGRRRRASPTASSPTASSPASGFPQPITRTRAVTATHLTRARRRAGGSASRTRCTGRSSARPSRRRA